MVEEGTGELGEGLGGQRVVEYPRPVPAGETGGERERAQAAAKADSGVLQVLLGLQQRAGEQSGGMKLVWVCHSHVNVNMWRARILGEGCGREKLCWRTGMTLKTTRMMSGSSGVCF